MNNSNNNSRQLLTTARSKGKGHPSMPMQAQRGGSSIAPSILNYSGNGPGMIPGIFYTGGWVDLRAGLDSTENLTPIGIRYQDRPIGRGLLYRLHYPGLLSL
jgi:hypothetical protein